MQSLLFIIGGAVLGILSAAPLAHLLRQGNHSIGKGFAAVIIAFLIIQAAMLIIWRLVPAQVAPLGVSATLSFLAATLITVLKHPFQ